MSRIKSVIFYVRSSPNLHLVIKQTLYYSCISCLPPKKDCKKILENTKYRLISEDNMENQRIQKLVKLAYIADIHGDYKIADKIFEKLAAIPPPRTSTLEDLKTLLHGGLTKLKELPNKITRAEELLKVYEKYTKFKDLTDMDLQIAFTDWKNAASNLPTLEAELKAHNDGSKLLTPDKLSEVRDRILFYKNVKIDYDSFFKDMKLSPTELPLSKKQLEKQLKDLSDELKKIEPDIENLPPSHPEKILIDKISAYLSRIQLEREKQVTEDLKSIIKQRERRNTRDTRRGTEKSTSTTSTTSTEKQSYIDRLQAFENAAIKGRSAFRRQLDKFFSTEAVMTELVQPGLRSREMWKVIFKPAFRREIAAPISEKLSEIVKIYDYKFIKAFEEETKKISGYNPDKHFKSAADAAARLMQDQPEHVLINELVNTIQSVLSDEIKAAKVALGVEKTPRPIPGTTPQTADINTIYNQIKKNNRNINQELALDDVSMKILVRKIDEGKTISIDDFLKLKQKTVPNMTNQYITPILWVAGVGGGIGGGGAITLYMLSNWIKSKLPKPTKKPNEVTGRSVWQQPD